MQWYVSNEGNVAGPLSAEEVREGIGDGTIEAGMFVRDEQGQWGPIEQSPFAGMFPQAAAEMVQAPVPVVYVAQSAYSGVVGVLAATLPFVCALFIVLLPISAIFWVLVAVVGTLVLITIEASLLRMGEGKNAGGEVNEKPIWWFVGGLLMWAIVYPYYLYVRRFYGYSSLCTVGALGVLAIVGACALAAAALSLALRALGLG